MKSKTTKMWTAMLAGSLMALASSVFAATDGKTDIGAVQTEEKGNVHFKWTNPGDGVTVTWPSVYTPPAVQLLPSTAELVGTMDWSQTGTVPNLIYEYIWKTTADDALKDVWGMGETGFSPFPRIEVTQLPAAPVLTGVSNIERAYGAALSVQPSLVSPSPSTLLESIYEAGGAFTLNKVDGGADIGTFAWNNTTKSFDFTYNTTAVFGAATFTLALPASTNQWSAPTDVTFTVTVTPINVATLAWSTWPGADSAYTYNRLTDNIAAAVDQSSWISGAVTMTYYAKAAPLTALGGAPVDVGEYIVTATATAANGYGTPAPLTDTFIINKKPATLVYNFSDWSVKYGSLTALPTVPMTTSDLLAADIGAGVAINNATVTATGYSQYGSVATDVFPVSGTAPSAGSSYDATGNYAWTQPANAEFQIVKNTDLTVTMSYDPQSNGTINVPYTITGPNLDNSNVVAPNVVSYVTSPAYTVTNGTFTATATGTVTVTPTITSVNYMVSLASSTFDVVIKNVQVPYSEITVAVASPTYTGESQTVAITKGGSAYDATPSYWFIAPDGTVADSVSVTEIKNAGQYIVYLSKENVDFTGTPNSITVGKAALTDPWSKPASFVLNFGSALPTDKTYTLNGVGSETLTAPAIESTAGTYTAWQSVTFSLKPDLDNISGVTLSNYDLTSVPTPVNYDGVTTAISLTLAADNQTITKNAETALSIPGVTAPSNSIPGADLSFSYDFASVPPAGVTINDNKITATAVPTPATFDVVATLTAVDSKWVSGLTATFQVTVVDVPLESGIIYMSKNGTGNGSSFANAASISRLTNAVDSAGITEIRIVSDVASVGSITFTRPLTISSAWTSGSEQATDTATIVTGNVTMVTGAVLKRMIVANGITDAGSIEECTVKISTPLTIENMTVTKSVIFGATVEITAGSEANVSFCALQSGETDDYGQTIADGAVSSFWLAPEGNGFLSPNIDNTTFIPKAGSILINRGAPVVAP